MPGSKGTNRVVQCLCNALLVVCLGYLGIDWLMNSGRPELDQVVFKYSLDTGHSIYGVRDGQGGATVGFSYRYYVHADLGDDQEILAALASKSPFLKTREPAVEARRDDDGIHLSVRGRVYEFSNYAFEDSDKIDVHMSVAE